MNSDANSEIEYSFEEFQLYYESTEKVVDRRLALNSWNYGLCLAVLAGIGSITAWSLPKQEFLIVLLLANIVLSIVGYLLCALWIGQIRDYKILNNAKFDVLNEMAPKIRFDATANVRSAEPFAKEWEKLKHKEAVDEQQSVKIVALKASNAEFLVPRAFNIIFIGVLLATAVFGIFNWGKIAEANFELNSAVAETSD